MPTEPETYVHRIGRTARAGASGSAVSFCDTEEKRLLKQVERLLGTAIPVVKQHPYAGVKPAPTEEDLRDAMFEARSKERMRARGQGRGRHRITSYNVCYTKLLRRTSSVGAGLTPA